MPEITDLHLQHTQQLFLNERSRRETIRGSISTPVAAISFAVFAFGRLAVELDAQRWHEPSALVIMVLSAAAIAALFASAWQVVMSEWLFVYHEPPRLEDLAGEQEAIGPPGPQPQPQATSGSEWQLRAILTASYAVAYEQYLRGNAASARHRTWALRFIVVSLLLQALAFAILPFHLAGA